MIGRLREDYQCPPSGEHVIVSNRFGQVTHKAIHFNAKKGLFAGISRETLPMRHVTSVRLETSRHWMWGLLQQGGTTWPDIFARC